MNKQIQELYKLSWVSNLERDPSNGMSYESKCFSADKFAELIVRECANLSFRSTGHVTSDGQEAIGKFIVDHFGFGE